MRIAVRRAAVAAALVPVLALSAACSGGGDSGGKADQEDKSGKGANSANGAGKGPQQDPGKAAAGGAKNAAGNGALTKGQLEKATLDPQELGKGFKTWETPADEEATAPTVDKRECRPLADVVSSKPTIRWSASVPRTLTRTDSADGSATVVFIRLSSYAPSGAEKVLSKLRDAVKVCDSYILKGEHDSKVTVAEADAPDLGDEALAYTAATAGDDGPVVTVVRVGTTTATFTGVNFMGKGSGVPESIIAKQVDKLRAESPKG